MEYINGYFKKSDVENTIRFLVDFKDYLKDGSLDGWGINDDDFYRVISVLDNLNRGVYSNE